MLDWTRVVFLALEWLWLLSGSVCLIAAGLAATGRLDLAGADRVRRPAAAMIAAGLFFPLALALYKLAQYHAFHVMMDSAVMGNVLWNFAHGHGLITSIYAGKSYLAIHFAFTFALLAPLAWLWNSMGLLAAAHGLAVGSCVPAAYLLGRRLGGTAWCGLLAGLLCVSSPFFQNNAIALIDNVNFAAPIFLWAAYAWASGRRGTAAALALLLLTTREQAPFLLAGVGACRIARASGRRERVEGLALIAACALAWFVEMSVIERAKAGSEDFYSFWHIYAKLGASPAEILRNVFVRPWLFAEALVWPPEKIATIARVLGPAGFLPLLSGWAVLPLLCVWLPHQLADPSSLFHHMREHYASLVFGPLLWSSILGLVFLLRSAKLRKPSSIWVLAACGTALLVNGNFRPPEGALPGSWKEDVPLAASHVPPGSKLWCDEFLSPHFAMRRYIKVLPQAPATVFETALFLPDRVLFSRYWIARSDPDYVRRVIATLERRKFVRLFEKNDLVVLARPGTEHGSDAAAEWVALDP